MDGGNMRHPVNRHIETTWPFGIRPRRGEIYGLENGNTVCVLRVQDDGFGKRVRATVKTPKGSTQTDWYRVRA